MRPPNFAYWPRAELIDDVTQADLSSADRSKAESLCLGSLITAGGPLRNSDPSSRECRWRPQADLSEFLFELQMRSLIGRKSFSPNDLVDSHQDIS